MDDMFRITADNSSVGTLVRAREMVNLCRLVSAYNAPNNGLPLHTDHYPALERNLNIPMDLPIADGEKVRNIQNMANE